MYPAVLLVVFGTIADGKVYAALYAFRGVGATAGVCRYTNRVVNTRVSDRVY